MNIISHRGNQRIGKENTEVALASALLKVDRVEVDIRQLKSGEFITHHNRKMKDHGGQRVQVSDLNLSIFKSLSDSTLTLERIISILPSDKTIIFDFKSGSIADFLSKCNEKLTFDQYYIASRNKELLKFVKSLNKKVLLFSQEITTGHKALLR